MANRSLWTAFVGPPSVSSTSSNFTLGPNFTVSVDGQVTHLMWYRGATGTLNLPQRISLWNRSSGTKIAEVVAPTDNGVVGWKSYALTTPVGLAAGVTYCVAGDSPAGNNLIYVSAASKPAPDANLAWPTNVRGIHTGAMNTYPETIDNVQAILYDIIFDDAAGLPPVTEPLTTADVDAIITSWFTLGVGNDHVAQLPNQTYEVLTDTSTGLPGVLSAIADVSAAMLTEESAILGDVIAKLDANTAWMTALAGPAGALLTGALRTYLDGLKTTADSTLALAGKSAAGPGSMLHATDPGWEEVDSGAFEGSFFVDARCDRVYVHITTIGENRVTNEVEGFEFLTAPWPWYAIFANMVGAYQTVMAREAVLYVPGVRMDGVLVKLPPDYAGTWTASMYP